MSKLRNKIIRLAYVKPELRKHLLPILKQASPISNLLESMVEKEVWKIFKKHGLAEYFRDINLSSYHAQRNSYVQVFFTGDALHEARKQLSAVKTKRRLYPPEAYLLIDKQLEEAAHRIAHACDVEYQMQQWLPGEMTFTFLV